VKGNKNNERKGEAPLYWTHGVSNQNAVGKA